MAGTTYRHRETENRSRCVLGPPAAPVRPPTWWDSVAVAEVVGEVQKEAELLDAEVGAGERRLPAPGVAGLDERLQHVRGPCVQCGRREEALGAGEAVEGGDEPDDEAVVALEGRAGFAGAVTGGPLRAEAGLPLCSARFNSGQGPFRSRMHEYGRVPRP